MKKCDACGHLNPNDNAFCENCAASIKDAPIVASKKSFSVNMKFLKYFGAAAALVLVIFLGSQVLFAKSAGAQVMSGLMKLVTSDQNEGHLELSFESEDRMMNNFLKDLLFVFDFEVKKSNAATKAELLIKGESALEAVVALQDQVIYVDLLDLYKDVFYYEDDSFEDNFSQYNQLRSYLKDISLKGVDFKKYIKAIESELGRDLSKKSGRVHLVLDEKNILDVMEVIFEEAENDEKLMKVLHKELLKVFKAMAKDDFEFLYMDGDDWESVVEEIEDFRDFKDNYEEAIADILDSIDWERDYRYSTSFDLKVSFDFGISNTIKAMDFQFDVEDEIGIKGTYKNKSEHGFKSFKKNKGIDLEDLMDDYDEMNDVSREVIENFADKIQSNKTMVKYIESSDFYKELNDWYGFDGVEDFFEMLLSNYLY